MKKTYYPIIILLFLASCSSLDDAAKVLKNEKIKTTDEFLVKKRKPLILPPNFEEIPEPDTKITKKENPQEKIKKMLKTSPNQKTKSTQNSKSLEKSILEKIKK